MLVLATLLLAVVCSAVVRANVESRSERAAATQARERGDVPSAVLHLRRSAQWHAFCCTPTRAALDELVHIGDAAAAEGRLEDALFAWRSARDAILAVRHVRVPNEGLLDDLHPRIARAMAEQAGRGDDEAARFQAQLDAWRERRANLALGAAAGLAAWGAYGAFAALFLLGVRPDGSVRRRPFLLALAAGLVLTLLWMLGVRFA